MPDLILIHILVGLFMLSIVTIISSIITFLVGLLFYFKEVKNIYLILKRLLGKRNNTNKE